MDLDTWNQFRDMEIATQIKLFLFFKFRFNQCLVTISNCNSVKISNLKTSNFHFINLLPPHFRVSKSSFSRHS